jgi:uncharacterized protein
MKKISKILTLLPIAIIKIYQKILSPEQSFWGKRLGWKVCRFHPTCSEYAIGALQKYGVAKGGCMATRRVLRCHPWNPGGHDPVP